MYFKICILATFFFSFSVSTIASLELPTIISDNMVLQQNSEVPIWGSTCAGEPITLKASWTEKEWQTYSDQQGRWLVEIETPAASSPHTMQVSGSDETIDIENILFGEVWLCGGQSNMSMAMTGYPEQPVTGADEELENCRNNKIRLFQVERAYSDEPLEDVKGKWQICDTESLKPFSATSYFFGKQINAKTKLPVGLIHSSWGGTVIEAWIRKEYLINNDELPDPFEECERLYSQWQKQREKARSKDKKPPRCPPRGKFYNAPTVLYNAMIAPLNNYEIKGVIWYHGESNADRPYHYRRLFPTMIKNWRCDFDDADMPFYYVQLANYGELQPEDAPPRDHDWARLREAQLMACDIEKTGMAVAIDIGSTKVIHPPNKRAVGQRLANCALADLYDVDIPDRGPIYEGYYIDEGKIWIRFSETGGGLEFKGDKPEGLAIAGRDREFIWADAEIDGDCVIVSSPKVKDPVAVRYAWDISPKCNLYNTEGLPASPFRTDNWD